MLHDLRPLTVEETVDTNGHPAVLDGHRGVRKKSLWGIARVSSVFRPVAKSSISAVEDKTQNSGSRY